MEDWRLIRLLSYSTPSPPTLINMHWRFFLFLISFFYLNGASAVEGIWNCEQSAESKEWVCVSEEKAKSRRARRQVDEAVKRRVVETRPQVPAKSEPAAGVGVSSPKPTVPAVRQKPVVVERAPVKTAIEQPPNIITKGRGWNCGADVNKESWNCSLIGADPKGLAHIMPEGDESYSLLTPAFDYQQEQLFGVLRSELKYDPWKQCRRSLGPPPDFISDASLRETAPMDVKADYTETFDNEVTGFFGNVDITRADQHMTATQVHYDTVSQTMDAQGDVFYSENALSMTSATMMLNLATDEARLRRALFISPTTPVRGSAKVIYRDSSTLSRYTDVAFTSCRPGNQDWVMHASKLKLNKASGKGTATGAWFEFKGVPAFYTPYIGFPLDNRRKSGFLTSSLGDSSRRGVDVSLPYYWNMAPNYDLTFTPRYMTKRGLMLGGQFRYLSKISKAKLNMNVLPHDKVLKKLRYLFSLKDQTHISPNLFANVDINRVSDDTYFNDLGSNISFNNYLYLDSHAGVNYNRPGVSFLAQAQDYQVIDKAIQPIQTPYQRLPQVQLNLNHTFDALPVDTALTSEFVDFVHSGSSKPTGQRFNIKPSISYRFATAGTYLTPKFSLQYTHYSLQSQMTGAPTSITRTLPIVSVDSGLYLERQFKLGASAYTHTIEPRLFYLYIPYQNQTAIPVFDSAEYDFNFNTLFRENLFSSVDRVMNANQVTAAVTSRFIDDHTGQENFRFSIGEIFYLQKRKVCLYNYNPNNPYLYSNNIYTGTGGYDPNASCYFTPYNLIASPHSSVSNLVTELSARLSEHTSFNSTVQWNNYNNQINRAELALRYINKPKQIVNLAYRLRKNTQGNTLIQQTDASFRWPLYDDWYVVGRWLYSLFYSTTLESFAGFEKESCCWRFRIVGRRWINTINSPVGTVFPGSSLNGFTGSAQTGFFVQLELKGLTALGTQLDQFLQKEIYGYQAPKK